MKRVLFALLILVFVTSGCQQGRFISLGRSQSAPYNEYGVEIAAVDQYAADNGLTRQEAVSQLRARQEALGTGTSTDGTAPAPAWSQQSGGPQ